MSDKSSDKGYADIGICVIINTTFRKADMHTYQTTIHLHQTDAAGLIFFSRQFEILHDAYEGLLEKIGFGFPSLLREQDFFLPIVHAESDYKSTLFVGDKIRVEVRVAEIGNTSFTLDYRVFKDDSTLVGLGKTVHVTMDKASQTKIPLPPEMRKGLEELQR